MPSFNEIKEPTQEHGTRTQINYLMSNLKSCPDCDTDEHVIITEKKEQVCLKCGLVVDDICLVHSYTKPQINYKTPSFRRPKEYDDFFHALLKKSHDSNIIHFNYTPKDSKNYEVDGWFHKYQKPTKNKEEKLILSYLNDAPPKIDDVSCSYSKGHHALSHQMACSIDSFGRSCYE